MILKDDKNIITISNDKMLFSLECGQRLRVLDIQHKASGCRWLAHPVDLFELTLGGRTYISSDFLLEHVQVMADAARECLSAELILEIPALCRLQARVSWISEPEDSYSLIIQLGARWPDDCPEEIYMHLPLFGAFGTGNSSWYLGACPQAAPDGTSVMPMGPHRPFDLPICNISGDQRTGFSMELRDDSLIPIDWNHLRNGAVLDICTEEDLVDNNILLRLQNTPLVDVFAARIFALENGWCEAFDGWRTRTRSAMDLSQYARQDLQWYRHVLYQHFTFAYSKEVFNYETLQFEPERLLADGEAFGGYDSVLLWYQYPRLGVDERRQWDFNHDIPGGLAGMRDFTRRCHERGVRVFLPYKPWDIRSDESLEAVLENVIEVVRETEIDGIWFDTMDSVPDGFRERIDAVRPGVIFCTEGYPAFPQNLEVITGHFDQFAEPAPMPHSHLFRYLLPENIAPVTSRWKIGAGKDALIQRAIFNGTGIVIWQDVFGAWLPFSKDQKAVLKRWKDILTKHYDTWFGSRPTPMYPVLCRGLYANRFAADDNSEVIYTLYNSLELPVDGRLLLANADSQAIEELWAGRQLKRMGGCICGRIEPGEILIIRTW